MTIAGLFFLNYSMFHRIAIISLLGLFFATIASAQKDAFVFPQDTAIVVNGNKVLLAGHVDTVETIDPVTGAMKISLDYDGYRSRRENNKIMLNKVPVQLNGEKIYSPYGSIVIEHCAELDKGNKYLAEYIQKKTRRQYKKLSNAAYNADIRNIVVNKEGKVLYYEYSGLYKTDGFNKQQLSERYLQRINKKVRSLMNKVQMQPATVNSQPVAYRLKHYELL